jgi:predicted O-methyltransferase YrrM
MPLQEFIAQIFPASPYEDFDIAPYETDLQGWNSTHPVFAELINKIQPELVIEVGSWKGASAIHMAGLAKAHKPDFRLVCIDTWTASNKSLWVQPKWRATYSCRNGFPTVYWQFLANVVRAGHSDAILPLPVTASCGAEILRHYGVFADLIYVDAGHSLDDVAGDLRQYWPLLRPGGYLLGDDYTDAWPGVHQAVTQFCAANRLRLMSDREKWFVQKPVPKVGAKPGGAGPRKF